MACCFDLYEWLLVLSYVIDYVCSFCLALAPQVGEASDECAEVNINLDYALLSISIIYTGLRLDLNEPIMVKLYITLVAYAFPQYEVR